MLGATMATFVTPASASGPVCSSPCNFAIGYAPGTASGAKEVGLQFQSDIPGWMAGVCFWQAPEETGTHAVSVWDASGTKLGTITSTLANTPGQENCVDFPTPVPIAANTPYTVSYTAHSTYPVQPSQFTFPLDNSPLHAPAKAAVLGTAGSFPSTANKFGDGYGVDVAFVDTFNSFFYDCASTLTAPTQPSSAPGNASATVSWGPAQSTPSGCVAGYVITSYLNGVAQTLTLIPGAGTTTVIPGLTNGQSYTFTIAAESGRLLGPASAPTGPVLVGTPTAATALKVSRASAGAIKVAFKPSRKNGSKITKYTATCSSSNGRAGSKSGKSGPLTVTGLTRGKNYRCAVRATNHRGTGPASARSAALRV
jgi:hypothetical protein